MTERLFLRLEGDPLYAPETSVPAGAMREVAVHEALQEQVSSILLYRETIPAGHALEERVLPDGSLRLIFHMGSAPAGGAHWPATVSGASAEPVLLSLRGHVEGLSVTLRTGAAATLLGVPAGELTGRTLALHELWPTGVVSRLMAQMAEAADDAARAELLQAALLHRLRNTRGVRASAREPALQAARLIARSGGRHALREVAATVGVGERRLQQIFRAEVGLSPRAWSRLARLHACLRALRNQPAPQWSAVAAETGFYDQSHLINEFQSLCGLTPGMFLERHGRRGISGSSNTGG